MTELTAKHSYLRLLLLELAIAQDVGSLENRIIMQKGVYLAQGLTDASRFYEFRWDQFGPYSPRLAEDYHVLASSELPVRGTVKLSDGVKEGLQRLRELLDQVPQNLSKANWFELLGSILFLKSELKYSDLEIEEAILAEKPHLASFTHISIAALATH